MSAALVPVAVCSAAAVLLLVVGALIDWFGP